MENLLYAIYSLMIPVLLVITGAVVWKRPSQYGGLGYRTTMAEKNPLTWHAAQVTCGKNMVKFYLPTLGATAIAELLVIVLHADESLAVGVMLGLLVVQVLMLIPVIAATERMLHRCFDKDGNPKQ